MCKQALPIYIHLMRLNLVSAGEYLRLVPRKSWRPRFPRNFNRPLLSTKYVRRPDDSANIQLHVVLMKQKGGTEVPQGLPKTKRLWLQMYTVQYQSCFFRIPIGKFCTRLKTNCFDGCEFWIHVLKRIFCGECKRKQGFSFCLSAVLDIEKKGWHLHV